MSNNEVYERFADKGRMSSFEGVRYCSRSEAKWAVVLKALGLRAYYEPSRYHLPSGTYEPDFWVPQLDAYLEVKPCNLDDVRFAELGENRAKRVFVVSGDMPQIPSQRDEASVLKALSGHIWQKWPADDLSYMLAREAQGRINIVPVAPGSLASGLDEAILRAYVLASVSHFD